MKAVLVRTGSVPIHLNVLSGSPRASLSVHDSYPGEKAELVSRRILMHWEANRRSISRALSEPDLIRSGAESSRCLSRSCGIGSQSFPTMIPEEESAPDSDGVGLDGIGSLMFTETDFDRGSFGDSRPRSDILVGEFGFSGGEFDNGRKSGGGRGGDDFGTGGFTGGHPDRTKFGAYYQEMLKRHPTDPLLLRNYAKFLHEVEKDTVKAEEYYGRAILANPADAELLSLYGKLVWETERDKKRAKAYFDQAVAASPDDCMVMGSYAQFLWEAEEDEEVDGGVEVPTAMVEAF